MSSRPRLAVLLLLGLAVLGAFAVGCGNVASPKGWASPALSDGQLVLAHRKDLFSYDASTLTPQWKFPTGDIKGGDVVALYGTPAIADGAVFVPTYDGTLYALNAETGAPLWAAPFETDGPLVGGVTVANGTVYFGSSDGKLYAVDAETGEERWPAFKTDKEIWSTPVIAGDSLYLTSLDSNLYVLNAATGQERWSFETDAGVAATPVVDEAAGRVYVGGFDARLRAIDLETHEEIWSIKAGNWFWSRPLVDGGIVYAPSLDQKVYAVSAATSEKEWAKPFATEAEVLAAPIVVGDVVFIADRDGNLYGLDKQTGIPAFAERLKLGATVLSDPILLESDGATVLGIVTTGGDLFLVDPETLQTLRQIRLTGS